MPAVDDALRAVFNHAGELVHHPGLTTALATGLAQNPGADPGAMAQSASLALDVAAMRELQAEAQELSG